MRLKNTKRFIPIFSCVLLLMGCESNNEGEITPPANKNNKALLTANIGTFISVVDNKIMSNCWSVDDNINVFNAEKRSLNYVNNGKFTFTSKENFAENTFSGFLVAPLIKLKEYDWYALYPYVAEVLAPNNVSATINIGNKVQNQRGNNNILHLKGTATPMWGKATFNCDSLPVVDMKHLSAVLRFNVKNSNKEEVAITKITLQSSVQKIGGDYFVNFAGEKPIAEPKSEELTYSSIRLNVWDGEDVAPEQKASFYMAIRPLKVSVGEIFTITVSDNKGKKYSLTKVIDSELLAGAIYDIDLVLDPRNATDDNDGNDKDDVITYFTSGMLGAHTMPYKRYDSNASSFGGGAMVYVSPQFLQEQKASEASNQEYVEIGNKGAYISWNVVEAGNGVTVRFTLPDDGTGSGTTAKMAVLVNGKEVKRVDLTSYWAYQYMVIEDSGLRAYGKKPTSGKIIATKMFFDETHFLLPQNLMVGDEVRLEWIEGEPIGIDFIEIEPVRKAIQRPIGAVSVTDYGAIPNDGICDLEAFKACIAAHSMVYIPEGRFDLSDRIDMSKNGVKIYGAGMWYSELFFMDDDTHKGGFYGVGGENMHVSDIYMNSKRSTRFADDGIQSPYRAFGGNWTNSTIDRVWIEHFTTGMWLGEGTVHTNNLKITNVRIRNNYADGINLAYSTTNSSVSFSNFRSNGDDDIATLSSKPNDNIPASAFNKIFNNTLELSWRAGGIGIFGGHGHEVYNNLVYECTAGTGIRVTSTFNSVPFDATHPIKIYNCRFYKSGTRNTITGGIYGAIELQGNLYDVVGIRFENIDIIDPQVDGIRATSPWIKDVSFKNVMIVNTGSDNNVSDLGGGAVGYQGAGIYCSRNGTPNDYTPTITLDNVKFSGCKSGNTIKYGYQLIDLTE